MHDNLNMVAVLTYPEVFSVVLLFYTMHGDIILLQGSFVEIRFLCVGALQMSNAIPKEKIPPKRLKRKESLPISSTSIRFKVSEKLVSHKLDDFGLFGLFSAAQFAYRKCLG